MFEGVNDDGSEVMGELWSFPLAILDDVIGQVKKGQLPRHLGCKQRQGSVRDGMRLSHATCSASNINTQSIHPLKDL